MGLGFLPPLHAMLLRLLEGFCIVECAAPTVSAHLSMIRVHGLLHNLADTTSSNSCPDFELMDPKSKQSKRRDGVLSSLNMVIEGLNLAENLSTITPAKAVFGTVGVIFTMIRVSSLLLREYSPRAHQMHTV